MEYISSWLFLNKKIHLQILLHTLRVMQSCNTDLEKICSVLHEEYPIFIEINHGYFSGGIKIVEEYKLVASQVTAIS